MLAPLGRIGSRYLGSVAGPSGQLVQPRMAPQVGLEPTTLRLTAGCSAIELLRSVARSGRAAAVVLSVSIISSSIQHGNRLAVAPCAGRVWRLQIGGKRRFLALLGIQAGCKTSVI